MNWRLIVGAGGLALVGGIFWAPPLWGAILVLFLVWRYDGEWLADFAFWLGIWQALWQGRGLGWYALFYLSLVFLAHWLWGRKKNNVWHIS